MTAVGGLDLSFCDPGIVGFLGPNGAGKTTTMRMLTGFLPMTEGTARICGHDVFEEPLQVKARVGYLPETPPLYPELTVGEYLRFVAEIRGVPRGERLARIGESMERVGLRGWEGRLTGSLSKGYRQRVGLAQAIVHNPPVLILDEPTSGLDPAQVVGVRQLIRELAADRLVVLSTHILTEIEQLCERVVLIAKGELVGDGSVQELAAAVGAGGWIAYRLSGVHDDVSARIAALDAVDTVTRLGGDLYRVTGDAAAVDALAGLALTSGWTLAEIALRRPSLEAVFLNVVGAEG